MCTKVAKVLFCVTVAAVIFVPIMIVCPQAGDCIIGLCDRGASSCAIGSCDNCFKTQNPMTKSVHTELMSRD